jgi:triosephosphate isomerase
MSRHVWGASSAELLEKADIDGALVDGASLDAASFVGIVKAR